MKWPRRFCDQQPSFSSLQNGCSFPLLTTTMPVGGHAEAGQVAATRCWRAVRRAPGCTRACRASRSGPRRSPSRSSSAAASRRSSAAPHGPLPSRRTCRSRRRRRSAASRRSVGPASSARRSGPRSAVPAAPASAAAAAAAAAAEAARAGQRGGGGGTVFGGSFLPQPTTPSAATATVTIAIRARRVIVLSPRAAISSAAGWSEGGSREGHRLAGGRDHEQQVISLSVWPGGVKRPRLIREPRLDAVRARAGAASCRIARWIDSSTRRSRPKHATSGSAACAGSRAR